MTPSKLPSHARPSARALALFTTLAGLLAASTARAHGDAPDLHVGYEYKAVTSTCTRS